MNTSWLAKGMEAGAATMVKLLAIILVAMVLRRALRLLTRRIVQTSDAQSRAAQQRQQQTQTLADLTYSTGSAIILLAAFLTALPLLGVEVAPLAAAAGLASLALGFGAQHFIRDLLNGFFIVLEDQYVVGETIRIGETTGRVEHLTLRRTVVRDLHGALCVIPNGEIRIVANLSRDWSQLFVDIALAPDDAVDRTLGTLEAICTDFRSDANWSATLVDGPRVLGVEAVGTTGATVRLQVRTVPTRQYDVARELRRRVRSRFEQEGLGMGGAHRVVITGLGTGDKPK
jgi:small conductance mechanosensitive channel